MRAAASPFVVNVSDLLTHVGKERRGQVVEPVAYRLEMAHTDPDQPMRADVVLRSIPGGIMVEGDVAAPAVLTCNRCLTEWPEEQHVRLRELFSTDADDDGDYHVVGDEVDLEPLLRDEVTLSLPLLPLCKPDCAGLCPICGADLNTDACPGHEDASSSPFAGLRDLLETQD